MQGGRYGYNIIFLHVGTPFSLGHVFVIVGKYQVLVMCYVWSWLCLGLLFCSIGQHVCFIAGAMLFLLLWLCNNIFRSRMVIFAAVVFCCELLWLFRVFNGFT